MPQTDSYDALASSIERALRSGIPLGSNTGLPEAIQRALLEEARLGELSIAIYRLPVVALSAVFGIVVGASYGRLIAGGLGTATIWASWSVWLLVGLRQGWYRLWLRTRCRLRMPS